MKTKQQYEEERWQQIQERKRTNTGVKCEKCDGEYHYSDSFVRASSPPKRQVKCDKCGYIDYILA